MIKDSKVLTISIAAYNVEKYIENTLESLICNKMDKLEVIIQNDGSKDKTAEIVNRYVEKFPNTFVLNNKENGGYGSTINASLDMAHGKYFKQLDGDDWFDNNNLDEFIDLLEKIDVDCVCTPFTYCYEDKNKTNTVQKSILEKGLYDIEDVMKSSNNIFIMHMLTYKLELLKKIELRILENCFYTDTEYVLYPLISAKNIFISDLNVYCYRIGYEGQSVSKSGIIKHYKEHEKVVYQILLSSDKIEKCGKYTKKAIKNYVKIIVSQQYIFYLTLPTSKSVKNEIIAFDKKIKELYSDYYNSSSIYRFVIINLLRCFNFKLYEKLSSFY